MALFGYAARTSMSEQSETRGLGDGGRPRRAAELAADVRDVAVHGMRTQQELLRDLAIAETAGDTREDLGLAT